MVLSEEISKVGASGLGFPVHTDIIVPYISQLGTEEQKRRWLPGLVSGELISAIAMTEPGAGSDLQGIRTTAVDKGDHYVLNGSKTFISNGIMSDLVIVVCRTDPDAGHQGISLLVVERGMAGFERGRNLEKVGLKAQDTAELFFDNVAGAEGEPARRGGLRLHLADGQPAAGADLDRRDRGRRLRARAPAVPRLRQGARGLRPADRQVPAQPVPARRDGHRGPHRPGLRQRLRRASSTPARSTPSLASMAKWWTTELQKKIVDQGVQLHGGYGYMMEYPIAKAFVDSRIQTIYGGTTEIQKEIIGRSLGI